MLHAVSVSNIFARRFPPPAEAAAGKARRTNPNRRGSVFQILSAIQMLMCAAATLATNRRCYDFHPDVSTTRGGKKNAGSSLMPTHTSRRLNVEGRFRSARLWAAVPVATESYQSTPYALVADQTFRKIFPRAV